MWLADQQAYNFRHRGSFAGTLEAGSRDDKWDEVVTNGPIYQNWRAIVATPVVHKDARVSTDWKALVDQDIAAAGAVIGVVNIS